MKKYVLSLSGGLDSCSLMFEYRENIALAVAFRYPSVHNERELQSAVLCAEKLGIPIRIVDVSSIFRNMNSGLLSSAADIPDGEFGADTQAACYVPFRNGIFLSILTAIAESEGLDGIAIGTDSSVDGGYPDTSKEFCEAFAHLAQVGTEKGLELFYPYTNVEKREIAKRGIAAGLNPDWTYSCYKGGANPCGTCPSCINRERALSGLTWETK